MNMFPEGDSVLLIFMLLRGIVCYDDENISENLLSDEEPEDARLNFTQLAVKYGRTCEEHDVTTPDGYILKLFRLPGGNRSVFMMHGNLGSADDFIIRGAKSLAVALSEAGLDVWLGNARGNPYSRRHKTFDPDFDKQFWMFTLQEVAVYDTASSIDYILAQTGRDQLTAIGFSIGTSMFYALASERPAYNEKIDLMISLAPICYTFNSPPLSLLYNFAPISNVILEALGIDEVSGDMQKAAELACVKALWFLDLAAASFICLGLNMAFTPGFHAEELEPEFSPVVMAHYPNSACRMFQHHFTQMGSNRRFGKYNYGLAENLLRCDSPTPPEYDLKRITAAVALVSGKDDIISTLKDVELLKKELPNVVGHIVLEPEDFNHMDFMWGRNTYKVLYPHIFDLLRKYT